MENKKLSVPLPQAGFYLSSGLSRLQPLSDFPPAPSQTQQYYT